MGALCPAGCRSDKGLPVSHLGRLEILAYMLQRNGRLFFFFSVILDHCSVEVRWMCKLTYPPEGILGLLPEYNTQLTNLAILIL
jgi:hypothetical protein